MIAHIVRCVAVSVQLSMCTNGEGGTPPVPPVLPATWAVLLPGLAAAALESFDVGPLGGGGVGEVEGRRRMPSRRACDGCDV